MWTADHEVTNRARRETEIKNTYYLVDSIIHFGQKMLYKNFFCM